MKKINANQKGFTLVELVVVVAILGVLAAVAVPNYMNYLYKSRVSTDVDTARAVLNAARTMKMTTGNDPSLASVLADADLTGAKAATGGNLESLLNGATLSGDNYSVTLTLGGAQGSYTLASAVTERGDLPVPSK